MTHVLRRGRPLLSRISPFRSILPHPQSSSAAIPLFISPPAHRYFSYPPPPSHPPPSHPPSQSSSHSSSQSAVEPTKAITEATGSELVLSPPALVVTREYEWGNIILGFEQANKYTIRAAPGGQVVGYIAEETSIGRAVMRNVLRTRRSFRATVLDKNGDTVFVLRRPAYLVSSSMYVEHPDGTPIGEIQMRWHVYRRRYDMYINKNQFGSVDSGFLAVDFDMRDESGAKIASVNKDFTGFAREIFTDARQYVLRLDPSLGLQADGLINDPYTVADATEATSEEKKLDLEQRAVLLATAISIDFDYFSLHSRNHLGPMMMPMPIPGAGGTAADDAGAAAGAAGLGEEGAEFDDGLGHVPGEEDGAPAGGFVNSESSASTGNGSEFDESPTDDFSAPDDGQQWGTFEETDHGFAEEPVNEDWSDVADSAEDGEGASSIFGIISDIFKDS